MATVCIPKIAATKLINSLKGDGLSRLQNMSSKERREFFSKAVGEEMGSKVNAEFERAIVANTKSALKEFAEKLTGVTRSNKKDVIARIDKLDAKGLFDGNVLEDYISEFLGAKISVKEVGKIKVLSAQTSKAEASLKKEYANVVSSGKITPEYTKSLVDYAKALRDTDEFLLGNTPNDWSSTLWNNMKASMLFNPASWNLNIISNLVHAGVTKVERRIANMRMSGYSSDLVRDWKQTMLTVRKETGYDMSRALSIDELLQKKVIGEEMSIGKDNFFTKFVYNGALGTPDAWAGRMAFADALDLETATIAHGMGLRGAAAKEKARELFLDGIQVVPTTPEGLLARKNSVLEAQFATWTNPGVIANATLKFKAGLNKFAEKSLGLRGFKLGDMIEPFVKTPANVAAYGLDASGLGIVRGAGELASLMKNYKLLTEIQRKKQLGNALRLSMRTGFGVGGAIALAAFIPEDNFVGAYDPNRVKYEQLRNSTFNAIRIGNKWYSLDYASGFAAPLVAVLYARKYGDGNPAKMLMQYAVGMADQTTNIPFVGSLKDIGVQMNQKVNPDDPNAAQKTMEAIYDIFNNQITSRVPGLVNNVAKLFDSTEKEATGFIETLQSKIPVLRNKLDSKQDMFGQDILTESGMNKTGVDKYIAGLTQILAGARIKTAKDTPHGNEVLRLKNSGTPVSLTAWKYRLGARQTRLKEKVGDDEYRRIYKEEYGSKMIDGINKKLGSEKYKKLSDADKKKEINKLNDTVMDSIYSKYKISLR